MLPVSVMPIIWRYDAFRRDTGTAAYYYHPDKILFSYIYHKHLIAQLFPSYLLVFIIRVWNKRQTLPSLHRRMLKIVLNFPFSTSPYLLYRSVGLKVHLFQLANDLFWAIGKYLSQLVLVLKSLRDGAEGSAKSINLSGNGDMIYAGRGAAPREQEDLAQTWKDEYTLLKIS